MVKKWQFVSNQVEDGAGKDEKTRKIVRKAAMKAFRKEQRLERTRKFMQENGEQETRTPEAMPGLEVSVEPEQLGTLVVSQRSGSGDQRVDLHEPVRVLQSQGWSNFEVADAFSWPREIVSLDPFGSSPLGTCATWHSLFMHCTYYTPIVFFESIIPWFVLVTVRRR